MCRSHIPEFVTNKTVTWTCWCLITYLGNFGKVFRATWRGFNVAVKQISDSDESTADFEKEAALLFKMWSVCMFLLGILI